MKNAVRMNRHLTVKRCGTFDPNVDRVDGAQVSIASNIGVQALNYGMDKRIIVNGNSFLLREVPKVGAAGKMIVMERQSNR